MSKGETRDTMTRPAPVPTASAVKGEIDGGRYTVTYDGTGLQHAGPSNSNPDSTWYAFTVKGAAGKVIGEYHIHPKAGGFASGNLKVPFGTSGFMSSVGRATDWQWLCDKVKSQV